MKLKQFLLLLLLAGTAATAQSIEINTRDAATGTRVILTRNHKGADISVDDTVAKIGLLFFSAGYQSKVVKGKTVQTYYIDLDMFHNNNKLGCIRLLDNNVLITLTDGTEIQCFQITDTECSHEAYKASFALTDKKGSFTDMEANFKKLQTVGIAKIVVTTTESELVYKMKSKAVDYIKAHFALVAKTLNADIKLK